MNLHLNPIRIEILVKVNKKKHQQIFLDKYSTRQLYRSSHIYRLFHFFIWPFFHFNSTFLKDTALCTAKV